MPISNGPFLRFGRLDSFSHQERFIIQHIGVEIIPDKNDDTSLAELLLITALFFFGLVFLLEPATATVGAFSDFVEMFPDPATLGPYGAIYALISLLLGTGGFLKNKFGG